MTGVPRPPFRPSRRMAELMRERGFQVPLPVRDVVPTEVPSSVARLNRQPARVVMFRFALGYQSARTTTVRAITTSA